MSLIMKRDTVGDQHLVQIQARRNQKILGEELIVGQKKKHYQLAKIFIEDGNVNYL